MNYHAIGTVSEVAEVLAYTPNYVRSLCRLGRIKGARKQGREWVIPLPPVYLPRPGKEGEMPETR